MNTLTAYLAFPEYMEQLQSELKHLGVKPKKIRPFGELLLVEGERKKPVWARNIWRDVKEFRYRSLDEASTHLKSFGNRWSVYAHLNSRELKGQSVRLDSALTVKNRAFHFPKDSMPTEPIDSYCVIAPGQMLLSTRCSQTIPNGDIEFSEDRVTSPTRAYLKLWEAFMRIDRHPQSGEQCIDLGSCPGGWTWVVAKLGAKVISVDRTEISPPIAAMPGVEFIQGNAFAIDPSAYKKMDWVLSDVICEPIRTLELVNKWMQTHPDANYVCNVKFKGKTDFKTLDALRKIPGSHLMHLSHGKNEITWCRLRAK